MCKQHLSERELAQRWPLSEKPYNSGEFSVSVRKVINTGRMTPEPDGTIDPDKTDRQWIANTDMYKQKKTRSPSAAKNEVKAKTLEAVVITEGASYQQAKTANEILKAQQSALNYKKPKGSWSIASKP